MHPAAKCLGVRDPLYMTWKVWRARGVMSMQLRDAAQESSKRVIFNVIRISTLHPKSSILLAFLPRHVASDAVRPIAPKS